MRAPKARAKIFGYFSREQHMTSSFSNSRGGGQLPQVAPSGRLWWSGLLLRVCVCVWCVTGEERDELLVSVSPDTTPHTWCPRRIIDNIDRYVASDGAQRSRRGMSVEKWFDVRTERCHIKVSIKSPAQNVDWFICESYARLLTLPVYMYLDIFFVWYFRRAVGAGSDYLSSPVMSLKMTSMAIKTNVEPVLHYVPYVSNWANACMQPIRLGPTHPSPTATGLPLPHNLQWYPVLNLLLKVWILTETKKRWTCKK